VAAERSVHHFEEAKFGETLAKFSGIALIVSGAEVDDLLKSNAHASRNGSDAYLGRQLVYGGNRFHHALDRGGPSS
jgi:hypothetical protein